MYYLKNENCCLNNTTKHSFKDEDLYNLHGRMIMKFGTPKSMIDNSQTETWCNIAPDNTFSMVQIKVKKLTFDINYWIKEVKKVKKLRVKKKVNNFEK